MDVFNLQAADLIKNLLFQRARHWKTTLNRSVKTEQGQLFSERSFRTNPRIESAGSLEPCNRP